MPEATFELDLRPTTLDDAGIVADLESLRDPTEPRDPVLLSHWWRMGDELEKSMRCVAVRDGAAIAYVGASHEPWESEEKRFGTIKPVLRNDVWSGPGYARLVKIGEDWLRAEGAATAGSPGREDMEHGPGVLEVPGYPPDRRNRIS